MIEELCRKNLCLISMNGCLSTLRHYKHTLDIYYDASCIKSYISIDRNFVTKYAKSLKKKIEQFLFLIIVRFYFKTHL